MGKQSTVLNVVKPASSALEDDEADDAIAINLLKQGCFLLST